MVGNREILAVIPARGGSKGVPRKNLVKILGLPLVSWSIKHALNSTRITRVIVSTDDLEIAAVAREFGAEVPFMRPKIIAGDMSTDLEVFQHTLGRLALDESYTPDFVVHLRPTSPIRSVTIIDDAIDKFTDSDADSLRSLEIAAQSPFKMWFIEESGFVKPALTVTGIKDSHSIARQDLPLAYRQNGYIDILRPKTIMELNSMTGSRVLPYIISQAAPDIDYPEDIPIVERMLKEFLINGFTDDTTETIFKYPT